MYYTHPTQSFGYYRGAPQFGGGAYGGGGSGPMAQGTGQFAQGQGTPTGIGGWNPTILYMFALIIAEMFVFGWLSKKV
jgi:hypothetical protein